MTSPGVDTVSQIHNCLRFIFSFMPFPHFYMYFYVFMLSEMVGRGDPFLRSSWLCSLSYVVSSEQFIISKRMMDGGEGNDSRAYASSVKVAK